MKQDVCKQHLFYQRKYFTILYDKTLFKFYFCNKSYEWTWFINITENNHSQNSCIILVTGNMKLLIFFDNLFKVVFNSDFEVNQW